MKRFRCIKTFSVERCDDDGFSTGREMFIKEGSIWYIEDEEDEFRVIDGEVRLLIDKKGRCDWLEITKETFENNFKLLD